MITLQFPRVQTAVAKAVVSAVSKHIDGDIHFEKIHLKPFTTLILKNATVIDKNPAHDSGDSLAVPLDTLFRAEYVIAKFSLESLLGYEGIHFDKAYISNAKLSLVIEDIPGSKNGETDVNLTRIFGLGSSSSAGPSDKEIFMIRKVEIRNMEFIMKNYSGKKTEHYGGMNWNDLDVREINILARNLRFKGGVMYGIGDRISFKEKSGFVCRKLSSTDVKVGNGKTIVKDLKLDDGMSSLKLPLFMMSYSGPKDFSDFLQKVKLDGDITMSTLDFRTLWYFAPQLKGNSLKVALSGNVSGYVSDLNVGTLKLASAEGGFSGTVSGKITGLPDINETSLDVQNANFNLTADGLGKFISQWMPSGKLDLGNFARGTIFMVDCKAEGLLNNLHVNADMNSMAGRLKADAILSNIVAADSPISIRGRVQTHDLNLGNIIGTDIVGQTTMRTGLTARFGKEALEADIDSLIVDRLYLNGYNYQGIAAAGELSKNTFNGKIICNDPSLNFLFQGSFALSSKTQNSIYRFYANIGNADLKAMNIDKRGKSKIRLQTNANFTRTSNGQMLGKVDIGGIVLENKTGKHEIGDINITSHSKDSLYKLRFNSKFADASFAGTASITDFVKDISEITLKKEIPALFKDSTYSWNGNTYNLNMKFHNSIELLAFAVPGLYVSDNTTLTAAVNKEGLLDLNLKSPRIAFKDQYIKDIKANFNNAQEHITGEITSPEIYAASMKLHNNTFSFFSDNNHIGAGYTYENKGELINRGEFIIHGGLQRLRDELEVSLNILPSTLYLNSKIWNIHSSSMTIRGQEIDVPSLEFSSGEEKISLTGRTSAHRKDTLTLSLGRFDLSVINALIGEDFGFSGAATGNIRLTSPMKDKGLLADLICDSTYIAGTPVGVLRIGSEWNEAFRRFDFGIKNDLDGRSSIDITGSYAPKHKLINANAKFDKFNISYIRPFVKDIFSDMGGYLSGDIVLDGPLKSLGISSTDTRIDDAMLKVAFINVPFYINGPFHLDSGGAYFDNIRIKDRYNGTGTVSGSINWEYFQNISFDTMINVRDMECVNINEKDADVFYGQVFASGKAHITGDLGSIHLNIDAATTKPGNIHIPLADMATGGGSTNLLKFKEEEKFEKTDPYEEMIKKLSKQKTAAGELGLDLNVTATPDVEAFIEIDKASGNVLSGRGNGNINLEINNDAFNIKGDYRLTDGKYRFSAMGIVNRDFQIQEGSTVNFTGDIMDSRLDIDAIYRTKASLSTLIADTSSVSNRRVVECGIQISDNIRSPRVQFSIDVPDLDPTVKARVESALSTEDKVQKQFLSLLITNNFLPDDQSGIVNNMYGNVGDLMVNQINNIFQKLDIPLDLGLNYQPNERGNDIFDVAVSTQLFNNRVIVNGNIGNRQNSSGNAQNGVSGDIEIEIKLDRAGSFRLNLFSHSADQYTNSLDNSQRSGIGLTYQTEFNSIGQFFRYMFSNKAKRQEAKLEEERQILEGERKIVTITNDDAITAKDRKQKRND